MMNPTSHELADLLSNLNSSDSTRSRRLPLTKPLTDSKLSSTVSLLGPCGGFPKPLRWSTAPLLLGLILFSASGIQAQVKTVKDDGDQFASTHSPGDIRNQELKGVSSQENAKPLTKETFSPSSKQSESDPLKRILLSPVKWGQRLIRAIFFSSKQANQQGRDPLAPIPTHLRSRFIERLTLLVRYQGTGQWAKMYELSTEAIKDKQSKEEFVRHLEKLDIDPTLSVILDFTPNEAVPLGELQDKGAWQVLGCGRFSEKGKIVEIKASVTAEFQNDEWFFSEVGAAQTIDGPEELCHPKLPASAADADAKSTRVVRLEADGEEMKADYKVFLSAYGQEFKTKVNNQGFVVPTELKYAETIDVKIVIGKERLNFSKVDISKFGEAWVIGIDHKPFSEELTERWDVSKVGVIYYITFQSKGGLDTRTVVFR